MDIAEGHRNRPRRSAPRRKGPDDTPPQSTGSIHGPRTASTPKASRPPVSDAADHVAQSGIRPEERGARGVECLVPWQRLLPGEFANREPSDTLSAFVAPLMPTCECASRALARHGNGSRHQRPPHTPCVTSPSRTDSARRGPSDKVQPTSGGPFHPSGF